MHDHYATYSVSGDSHLFKPVVDSHAKEAFIPEEPLALLTSGEFNNVPMIIGSNKDEGLFVLNMAMQNSNIVDALDSDWDSVVSSMLLKR
jgi:carboxylesterase type B